MYKLYLRIPSVKYKRKRSVLRTSHDLYRCHLFSWMGSKSDCPFPLNKDDSSRSSYDSGNFFLLLFSLILPSLFSCFIMSRTMDRWLVELALEDALSALDEDVLLRIFNQCSVRDCIRMGAVCKLWLKVSRWCIKTCTCELPWLMMLSDPTSYNRIRRPRPLPWLGPGSRRRRKRRIPVLLQHLRQYLPHLQVSRDARHVLLRVFKQWRCSWLVDDDKQRQSRHAALPSLAENPIATASPLHPSAPIPSSPSKPL